MADRILLHIGAMKSGTSFVQNVLYHHRDRLAELGVLVPGERWRSQVQAVKDFIGHGGRDQPPLSPEGHWAALVREIEAWPGTAVVSMEFLGPRSLAQVHRLRDTFPDSRVEAVLSCRDLGRTIPAMWLESTQNGSVTGWQDYLDAVRAHDRTDPAGRQFWRHQSIGVMARRWAEGLGEGRLTVLTVPPPGAPPTLLWERFASLIGVDPTGFDLDVRANPSVGLATAQMLLAVNRHMVREDGTQPPYYDLYVKHVLSKRGLGHRHRVEPRLGFDEEWVAAAAERQIRRLRAGGHRVLGDLEELRPTPVPGVHADAVGAADQLDAAVDAIAVLVESWAAAERERRRAGGAGPAGSGPAEEEPAEGESAEDEPAEDEPAEDDGGAR